jgi:hypothetical protein
MLLPHSGRKLYDLLSSLVNEFLNQLANLYNPASAHTMAAFGSHRVGRCVK